MSVPFTPPLLLAGPVLRKVTPTAISVWVATSQACTVTVEVYGSEAVLNRPAGASTGTVSANLVGGHARETVQLGEALHVAVVTSPIAGVPPDAVCSYNVTLSALEPGGSGATGSWDLGGLLLLEAGDLHDDSGGGLGYAQDHLPTFPTPPAIVDSLRLYHGSCFKLHGDGLSMMPSIDDMLSDTLPSDAAGAGGHTAKTRPHLLMLTGDQIYADEAGSPLLPFLTQLGDQLLRGPNATGSPESIPVNGEQATDPTTDRTVDQLTFPAGRRHRLMRATAGMTTDVGDSHLIGLGEWCAMYLLSWTGRLDGRLVPGTQPLWPRTLAVVAPSDGTNTVTVVPGQGPEQIVPDPDTNTMVTAVTKTPVVLPVNPPASPIVTQLTPPGADRLDDVRTNFPTMRTDLGKVGDDGEKVRRALANIPVLTICDDHEVTDDWFITGAWRARVLGQPFGRAVVRNALIAYVLFQAWGNTPEPFEDPTTPEGKFLGLVPQLFGGSGTQPDPGVCTQIESLLGLNDATGTGTDPRLTFNYHVDIAGARLVVLDTRTHREYGTPYAPPGLLTAAALDAQLPISLTDDVPVLIVVSPAPVLGPRLIEEMVVPLGTRAYDVYYLGYRDAQQLDAEGVDTSDHLGELFFDLESWSARPIAFERFLDRVTRCPRVVILAGDVHYAASFTMDYQRYTVPPSEGGVTPSDPLPTSSSSRVVHFTSSAIRNQWPRVVPLLVGSLSLAEHLEQAGFDGTNLGWTHVTPPVMTGGDDAAGEPRPLRTRLHREPVILPTAGWGSAHAVRPPEWQYRVAPLADTRTDDLRLAPLQPSGFTQWLGANVPDAAPPPDEHTMNASLVGSGGVYETATALHAANVDSAALTRTLLFQNNVGVVTFGRTADNSDLTVQMALYFVRAHPASEDEKPLPLIVHSSALTPIPLIAPTQVGPPPPASPPAP